MPLNLAGGQAGPPGTEYCSLADARAAGCTVTDDTALHALIVEASRIVDDYCGSTFGAPAPLTYTASDVRQPLVPLPTPFSAVTAVTINGAALDPTSYIVEKWGIRLYSTAPFDMGWPMRGAVGGGGAWPYQSSTGPFGFQVAVTATFGFATIPALVVRATKILSRDICQAFDGPYERHQTRALIGAFDAQFTPHDPHPLDTTGDAEVDRLLRSYRRSAVLVA